MGICIKYADIVITTVADRYIPLCTETRKQNCKAFFSSLKSDSESEQWIREHRYDPEDTILAVTAADDQFIGTIGYTVNGESADIGRLAIYLPAMKELIHKYGKERASVIMRDACRAVIDYVFLNFPVTYITARVLETNSLSRKICTDLGCAVWKHENEGNAEVIYRMDRELFLKSLRKYCLFYQHNIIENTHYAVSDVLLALMEAGVRYDFAAKTVMKNEIYVALGNPHVITVDKLPFYKDFYKKYNLIHAVFDGEPALMLCAAAYVYGIPYVLSFQGGNDTNSKILQPDLTEKTIKVANHAAMITVVCESDRRLMSSLGFRGRIAVFPPTIREDYGRKENKDRYRIAVVGRFIPKKGIDIAIQALCYMPEKYKLDIIGEGELEKDLKVLAEQCGVNDRIIWHGFLPMKEMKAVLDKCGILWHPARKDITGNAEGIPQILLNAMQAETCVVTTASGHITDLICDGINGIIVPPDDPEALAQSTLKNIGCMERYIKTAACSLDEYDIKNARVRWTELYRNIKLINKGEFERI
jgi:glycosyltransferase involved in cell wall biosynthesis